MRIWSDGRSCRPAFFALLIYLSEIRDRWWIFGGLFAHLGFCQLRCLKTKLKHWRGAHGVYGWRGSPVLVFRVLALLLGEKGWDEGLAAGNCESPRRYHFLLDHSPARGWGRNTVHLRLRRIAILVCCCALSSDRLLLNRRLQQRQRLALRIQPCIDAHRNGELMRNMPERIATDGGNG